MRHIAHEALGAGRILGHDRIGMTRSVSVDMSHGFFKVGNDLEG